MFRASSLKSNQKSSNSFFGNSDLCSSRSIKTELAVGLVAVIIVAVVAVVALLQPYQRS